MSTLEPNEPEGWTLSEYKSFHVTNNDSESSDADSDDEEEQEQNLKYSGKVDTKKLIKKSYFQSKIFSHAIVYKSQ